MHVNAEYWHPDSFIQLLLNHAYIFGAHRNNNKTEYAEHAWQAVCIFAVILLLERRKKWLLKAFFLTTRCAAPDKAQNILLSSDTRHNLTAMRVLNLITSLTCFLCSLCFYIFCAFSSLRTDNRVKRKRMFPSRTCSPFFSLMAHPLNGAMHSFWGGRLMKKLRDSHLKCT